MNLNEVPVHSIPAEAGIHLLYEKLAVGEICVRGFPGASLSPW